MVSPRGSKHPISFPCFCPHWAGRELGSGCETRGTQKPYTCLNSLNSTPVRGAPIKMLTPLAKRLSGWFGTLMHCKLKFKWAFDLGAQTYARSYRRLNIPLISVHCSWLIIMMTTINYQLIFLVIILVFTMKGNQCKLWKWSLLIGFTEEIAEGRSQKKTGLCGLFAHLCRSSHNSTTKY